jgi:cyclophilin family peptidyl-prolyl cis-trans isomerase
MSTARAVVMSLALTVMVSACAAETPSLSPGQTLPPIASAGGGGSPGAAACPKSQPAPLPAGQTRTVSISTSQGPIVIKVEGDLAPIAAGNFVALASCGFYDSVVFHRLVPGFVIQGGDPTGTGSGGPGYTIQDEPVQGDYVRGAVAMARTTQPNSQGSQFFICLADLTGRLQKSGGYVIFGHVTSGMDTVDKIAAMPNAGDQNGNQALQPVAMDSVTVTNP